MFIHCGDSREMEHFIRQIFYGNIEYYLVARNDDLKESSFNSSRKGKLVICQTRGTDLEQDNPALAKCLNEIATGVDCPVWKMPGNAVQTS